MNGELVLDILNPDEEEGLSASAVAFDATFSPLLHFGPPRMEAFAGPKVGVFGFSADARVGNASVHSTAHGLTFGLNAGVAVPAGKAAFGALVSYTQRRATESCLHAPSSAEVCNDSPAGSDLKQVSVSVAMLF